MGKEEEKEVYLITKTKVEREEQTTGPLPPALVVFFCALILLAAAMEYFGK